MCLTDFVRPRPKVFLFISSLFLKFKMFIPPALWEGVLCKPHIIFCSLLNGSSLKVQYTYKISPIPSSGWLKVVERARFTVYGHSLVWTGVEEGKTRCGDARGKHLNHENRTLEWSRANICWSKGGCDHTISPDLYLSQPESNPFSRQGRLQLKRNWRVKWGLQWCLSWSWPRQPLQQVRLNYFELKFILHFFYYIDSVQTMRNQFIDLIDEKVLNVLFCVGKCFDLCFSNIC